MAKPIFLGLLGVIAAAGAMAACSSGANETLFTGGAASTSASTTGSGTTTSQGGGGSGSGGCTVDAQCSDGIDCTTDACVGGVCTHAASSALCAAGSFCEVHTGCIPSMACATDAQCLAALGGDACKVSVACDPSLAICTYATLDKDADGHPPAVCGGDDCDDADPTRFPGAPELCDGKDNDCDGELDEGATCPGSGTCQAGACTCTPAEQCNGVCVDKNKDPSHCGTCGNACPSGAQCVGGACKCGAGKSACGSFCVDTAVDPNHCGNCTTACTGGATCQGGTCACAAGFLMCNGACVDPKGDPANCGSCNTQCSSCNNGTCINCPEVDLFVLVDLSGSMETMLPNTMLTRLQAAQSALTAFFTDPQSSGLNVGIGYYPVPASGNPPTMCNVDADCGAFGPCFINMCLGAANSDSCMAADYAVPAVPIAPLPGNAPALVASLQPKVPIGATPQVPALDGALTYAKTWATTHPTHKVAVLLVTDGLPTECTQASDASEVIAVAAPYAMGSPSVKTFVLTIANDNPLTQYDMIAAAGGTNKAYPALDAPSIQPMLNSIRSAWKTCP